MSSGMDKAMRDFQADAEEIIQSTVAVKGQAFATIAAMQFEAMQLGEGIGYLGSMLRETKKFPEQQVEGLCTALATTLAHVIDKATAHLDKADFEEAMNLGQSLYERRVRYIENLQRG